MTKQDHTWELLMDELREIKADIKEIKNNHLSHLTADVLALKSQLDVIKGERKGITVSWQFLIAVLTIAVAVWGVVALYHPSIPKP